MNQATVNQTFIEGINRAVDRVQAARRVLPPSVVETKIIPAHEDYLQSMIGWRLDRLSEARVFGAYGAPVRANDAGQKQNLTGVPAAIQKAYLAQIATINTAYNTQLAALKKQINGIKKDIDTKIAQAKKLKDTAGMNALKSALVSARAAYQDGMKAADIKRQADTATLASNFQSMLNQAAGAGSNVTLPPASSATTQPSPVYDQSGGYVGGGGGGGGTDPWANSNSGYDTVMNDSMGGSQPQPGATNAPVASETSIIDDLFSFINVFLGGAAAAPANGSAPVQSVAPQSTATIPGQVVQYDQSNAGVARQLDVFGDEDPWGGTASYGEFVPIFGNRTIRRLNQMSAVPKSAIGFSQWGAIISGVVQAAGQVGASAASAALAPKVSNKQAPPLVMQQPASSSSSSAPWLIGGGVAMAVVAVALLASRKRK